MKEKIFIRNDIVILKVNNKEYYLSSHPYEPCLYIKHNDKIISIIHNSFDISTIIDMINNRYKVDSITGQNYDINKLYELLVYVINNNIYEADIGYIENKLLFNNNIELKDDIFYKEYNKLNDCVLDYCIIKNNELYNGIETHKKCVIYAINKWGKEYNINYNIDENKMIAKKISVDELFSNDIDSGNYCYLFLNPPHGSSCTIDDFNRINNILFPNGTNNLEIFDWSTDWSNYFEEGLEWWGAKCISIYDKSLERFIVIGASATD